MNSFMRQSSVPTDNVHSFLKDKQAWENAIAMYQGPDPLDHWFNYICWYKNHMHGDPENKFRETLERCLTLYEHSEFYKQDSRMVRLWLKYIEMQQNPLHFYQVLHQRGVGKQLAMFYIAWASYYESVNAHKETEAVFNLGFQEKAQPYAELHHAYSKVMYARQLAASQSSQQLRATHVQQQQQQQQLAPQQAQHSSTATQAYYAQHQQQQEQPHAQRPANNVVQTQQQHNHQSQQYFNAQQQQQQQVYQQTISYQEAQNRYAAQTQAQQNAYTTQQQPQVVSANVQPAAHTAGYAESTTAMPPVQQPSAPTQQHKVIVESNVPAIQLPPKFATFSYNSNETWRPLLFLEEPDDPSRKCHYLKNIVYPPGSNTEYSPEEIWARKFQLKRQNEQQQQDLNTSQPVSKQYALHYQQQQQLGVTASQQQAYNNDEQASGDDSNSSNYSDNNEENESGGGDEDDEDEEEEEEEDYDEEDDEQTEQQQYKNQNAGDLEDQIEASTIRFTTNTVDQGVQNKTIKIKFKKEQTHAGASINYSAYTVESVYKAELSSPTTQVNNVNARRNGHTFHPYMLSHTSTPKTASSLNKRSKSKIKRVNKYQIGNDSNSNSFLAEGEQQDGGNERIANGGGGMHNATYNDNANYSFSSATALDNSNCSISSAVGRLNFRDTTNINNHNASAATAASTTAEFSIYQENSYFATQHDEEAQKRRLAKAEETIARHLAKEAIDPFSSELCRAFLTKLDFPGTDDEHANYKIIQSLLPKINNTKTLTLPDGIQFNMDKEVGRGSYGSVYKATDARNGAVVALKYQKPPNTWEIYICDQVLKRITNPSVLPGLMDVSTAIIAPNASLIATEFSPFGSLLDINNKIRQATTKVMHESLVMHFSAQICSIVHELHKHKIIHADIKPDNFLLMRVPSTDLYYPSLRLIDFGCAIDMTLFPDPDKTKFRKVIQTDGFTCIEMQEGRLWSYETDLFCIAGTVHVMLFGEYMQVQKRADTWDIKQKLPRYLKKHVWTKFFGEILNIKKSTAAPDLNEMKLLFEEEAYKMDSELQKQIRSLSNILHRR